MLERTAAAPAELARARVKTHEAREQLAKARIPVDESGVAVAQRALEQAERDYAVKRDELELKRKAKRGEVEAARLELANLELERAQAVIRSPIDGVVTAGDWKVGDLLEPGKAAVEIARQAGFLFEAAIPSEEIAHVRVGMPARIRLDAYDFQRYGTLDGTVGFVSPDSGVAEGQTRRRLHREDRDEPGRDRARGVPRPGQAGDDRAGRDRDGPRPTPDAPREADPPDDQPELKRLESNGLSPISNAAGPAPGVIRPEPTRPRGTLPARIASSRVGQVAKVEGAMVAGDSGRLGVSQRRCSAWPRAHECPV